jgi:hypothetical protein
VSLALAVQRSWTGLRMPSRPPPGATNALLLNQSNTPISSTSFVENQRLSFSYLGAGRRLEFDTREPRAAPPLLGGEVLSLGDQQLIMLPGFGQSYRAKLTHTGPFAGPPQVTLISAFGYTRAELLDVLRTFGQPTLETYRTQARLFADPRPRDAAFEALLGALEPPPGDGAVQHTVEQMFVRQNTAPDSQADPYHMPRYAGLPERTIRETWARGTVVSGTLERVTSTVDANGALYARAYTSRGNSWVYNAATSQLEQFTAETMFDLDVWSDRWQPTILNMLVCGQAELLTNADDTRTLFLSEASWQSDSCQHPAYPGLLAIQTTDDRYWDFDRAPYLADISDQAVTTWVDLDTRGRLLRIEVRIGTARDGMLLQSWELLQDELLPAERVPATAFDPTPPEALVRWRYSDAVAAGSLLLKTVTLTEALGLAHTPLFGLSQDGGASSALTGTGVLTSTGALTSTAPLSATLLSIEAGAPTQAELPRSYIDGETPLQSALRSSYALRLTYGMRSSGGPQNLYLYEGPAKEFGAYLRATARWHSSAAVRLDVDGRTVDGWQVTDEQDRPWTLFEIDGTLIAVGNPFDQSATAIARLRRMSGP